MKSTADINEIRRLLDRFYLGQTTPDEEASLRSYFEGEVDPSSKPTLRCLPLWPLWRRRRGCA